MVLLPTFIMRVMKHCGKVTSSSTCTVDTHMYMHTHVSYTVVYYVIEYGCRTDGVPYDGVPRKELVTIHPALTAVVSLLVAVGLVLSIVCLLFNIMFRKKK